MEQKTKTSDIEEKIVRILSKDLRGGMKVYPGLTKVKGISWSFSNALCKVLKIDKNKKIGSLTNEEIAKISDFVKNPKLPEFLMNRRFEFETGKTRHLNGIDLELRNEFDIKRLKKNKSLPWIQTYVRIAIEGAKNKGEFQKK